MRIQRVLSCSMAATLAIISAKSLQAESLSRVTANAGGLSVQLVDEDEGGPAPHASVSGSAAGAVFSASASTSVDAAGVGLHAYAFAQAPPEINEQTYLSKGSAGASAEWYDELSLAEVQSLPIAFLTSVQFAGLRLRVFPTVDGSVNGLEYTYQLNAGLSGSMMTVVGEPLFSDDALVTKMQRVGGYLVEDYQFGGLPLENYFNPYTQEELNSVRVSVYMRLQVSVVSHPGDPVPGVADYSHTVRLGPIFVSDANGNYLPGSEHLKFVGDSGIVYSVQPVPEPAALLLTATGAVALLLARRRKDGSLYLIPAFRTADKT